jgi:ribosome recycling factor
MLNEIQNDCNTRMTKTLEALDTAFGKIRAGRAHPSLLDHVQVDYYGSLVPISQVANISAEDSRTLKVSPWEKDMVSVIEKAIITSDLGLNPTTQGQIMRIPLPPLTEERRHDLVKVVREEAENSKIAIRNIRRDNNDEIKEYLKEKEISEDEARSGEVAVQKITDEFIAKIDAKLSEKETSLIEM